MATSNSNSKITLKPPVASGPRSRNGHRYSVSGSSSSSDDESDDELDGNRGGFVKGSVSYTVTDDLVVSPMPTVSKITSFLKNFDIKNLGAMEEKVVDIGKNEVINLNILSINI
ncbi:hypothetical protein SSX86_028295 [Deinandra increscens subsp. villosa]|uniref:Uncharacterized protein n=1 Tax=Deinandra increscens subsp. villosa TaxID=3103831 RepID=A0AAP0CDT0_9ASTR